MSAALATLLDAELRRAVPAPVSALAAQLASRAGVAAAAVLYYGSTLRDDTLSGLLDFYIVVDEVSAWPGSAFVHLGNRLLPPNVGYYEGAIDGTPLRAKYAVLSHAQFAAAMSPGSFDTTLWARFSQPCACVWARAESDRAAITDAVQHAAQTAAWWAAVLGPTRGAAPDYWRALFAETYRTELRVESGTRSGDIVARDAERYAALLPLAWQAQNLAFTADAGTLQPQLDAAQRKNALQRWAQRRRLGKPLNVLRLLKAALTFDGAMDYVVWKVERHSGVKLEVSPWQRRFPLLAAPGVYWQLRKRGVLR